MGELHLCLPSPHYFTLTTVSHVLAILLHASCSQVLLRFIRLDHVRFKDLIYTLMDDVSIQYIHRSEPYDPYLPRDGSSSSSGTGQGNPKTAAIQAQINDTVGIMKTNLDKVMERGELVDSLHDKTGMSYLFPCFFCCCALLLLLLWYLFFSNTDTCGLGGEILSIYCRGCLPELTCHVSIDR